MAPVVLTLTLWVDPACTGAPSTEQAIGQELITKCAIMTPDRVGLGVQKDQELDPAPQGTSGCTRLYKDEGCNEDVDKKEISLVDVPYNRQYILLSSSPSFDPMTDQFRG